MHHRDGPVSSLLVSMTAKACISLCVVGGLLLSACTTTPPREDHPEAKVSKPAPLPAPLATLAKIPVAPVPSTIGKTASSTEPPAKESEDQEPDPASNIFFSLGSAEIPVAARATIQGVADILKEHRRKTAILVGGTDGLGSRELCIAISSKRTDAVEAALLELGVRPSQIRKSPRGCEEASRQACGSEACQHKRRRVEIQYSE